MKRSGRLIDRVAHLAGYLVGWLVPLIGLLVFIEVITRYVLQQPLMVADELSGYMLVALSFIGGAYTWKERGHVRVTILVSRLPQKAANWLRVGSLIVVFVFVVGLLNASYAFIATSFRMHLASPTWLHIPMQGPHMTLLIGFLLLALVLIVDIARAIGRIKDGKNVEEATG